MLQQYNTLWHLSATFIAWLYVNRLQPILYPVLQTVFRASEMSLSGTTCKGRQFLSSEHVWLIIIKG